MLGVTLIGPVVDAGQDICFGTGCEISGTSGVPSTGIPGYQTDLVVIEDCSEIDAEPLIESARERYGDTLPPIVVLLSQPSLEKRHRLLELGVNTVIDLPCSSTTIVNVINRILHRRRPKFGRAFHRP